MNWIRENKFWSGNLITVIVILGVVGYVYYATPLNKEREKAERLATSLSQKVEQSPDSPELKGELPPIPPKQFVEQIKKRESLHRKDVGNMAEAFLNLGKGIERWFEGERNPKEGLFETYFKEHRKELENRIDSELETVQQGGGGGIFGGGGNNQQRIDWPDNPAGNMKESQKRFWIIKRLIHDSIESGATSVQNLSFENKPPAVSVLGGETLADRYLVSCDVLLPPEQTGAFLARLLKIKSEGDSPELMMHVNQYRISKQKTTSSVINTESDGTGGMRFSYPLKVKEEGIADWKLENLSAGDLPESLRGPADVKISFLVMVYDPYEPTIASVLKEAGYDNKQLKEAFRPFYTKKEFNSFVNGN